MTQHHPGTQRHPRTLGPTTAQLATVHRLLAENRQTVAVAESLTGGLLAAALTDTPGASATFRGGVVVYATDLKSRLADVDEALLAAHGPVDPEVAQQLASGVRRRLSTDWGLATTGVAGPQSQGGHPVGTVYLALAGPQRQRRVEALVLSGDRNEIRILSVSKAVALLTDALANGQSDPMRNNN